MCSARNLFVCAIITLATLGTAQAATVANINANRQIVLIDEGQPAGMKKGMRVCFFDENDKSMGCGVIAAVNAKNSIVRINNPSLLSRIKKGTIAKASAASKRSGSAAVAATGSRKVDNRSNFKLGYVATLLAPISYNQVSYAAPIGAKQSSQDTLWNTVEAVRGSLVGAVAEAEMGIGSSSAISLGLRYRLYASFKVAADYSSNSKEYVEITQDGSSMGVYSDFTFLNLPLTSSLFFRASSGLDFDMNSMTLKAIQKADDSDVASEIASYKASSSIISLRLGSSLTFMIGSLGIVTPAVNLLIPVMAMGESVSAKINDPQTSFLNGGAEQAEKNLIETIDFKKSSLGAEVTLSALIAF